MNPSLIHLQSRWQQTWDELFPAKPAFTEKDIPDQNGRVFMVLPASAGIGYEVAKALFHLNGRVYIASRFESTAQAAILKIRASSPAPDQVVKSGKGENYYLHLDLGDLTTVKASAKEFLSKESRLDVVWHNAGVMMPSHNTPTKQGYRATSLALFYFNNFLHPSASAPPPSLMSPRAPHA